MAKKGSRSKPAAPAPKPAARPTPPPTSTLPSTPNAGSAAGDAGTHRSVGVAPRPWRDWLRERTRLQIALGISLLLHGTLMGLKFAAPERFDQLFMNTPLEVILVNAKGQQAPEKAQAVAQASLAGGGDQVKARSTSPLVASARDAQGDANEDARRRLEQLQEQQQQLLPQVKKALAELPPPDPSRDAGRPQDREQEERRRQLLKLLAEIERRIQEENSRPRKRYISPATREVAYALYYDTLRRRIEDRGTRDFPEYQGKKLYGTLMMNLTVDAAGHLVASEVVQTSGNPALDRRAVAIVRAAGPFGNFSPEMRRQSDLIVVTSRFRFTREEGLEATMSESPLR